MVGSNEGGFLEKDFGRWTLKESREGLWVVDFLVI